MKTDELEKHDNRRRFALLIDGDNISAVWLTNILAEVNKHGLVTIRRIYGDWTRANMNGWRTLLHDYAARPIQQFHYTAGKNATDCALIIDAMDILYSGRIDGFCLAASDSDYTRLAIRIREEGLFAMGVGRKQTPMAFVNACDLFVYEQDLSTPNSLLETTAYEDEDEDENEKPISLIAPIYQINGASPTIQKNGVSVDPIPLLRQAVETTVEKNGWSRLNTVGGKLRELDPHFSPHRYGHRKLSNVFKAYPQSFRLKYNGKMPVWVGTVKVKETLDSTTLLKKAFGRAVQEKGWINLNVIENTLQEIDPAFNPQQYGHQQLAKLVEAHPDMFEIKPGVGQKSSNIYVRVKQLTIV
jgi:uncharacterized LabA/DUF88 family protein